MKSLLLAFFLAGPAAAGVMTFGLNPTTVDTAISGTAISPSSVTITNMTSGSVIFSTTSGQLSQDNANFFYKPSSSGGPQLGVGISPTTTLHVNSSQSGSQVNIGGTSTNSSGILFTNGTTGNLAQLLCSNAGACSLYTGGANFQTLLASAGGNLTILNGVVASTAVIGSGATVSTFSATGALTLAGGAALTASGANGNIVSASSITTTGGVFGNSAIFSGQITENASGANIVINDNVGTNPVLYFRESGVNKAIIQDSASALNISGNTGGVIFAPTGGSNRLTLTDSLASFTMTGTSPAATFSPNLSSSTTSGALSGTFTTTTMGPCIAGSTITLTLPTNVGKIMVVFNGSMSDGNLAANIVNGILVDGGFTNGETASVGLVFVAEPVISNGVNESFSVVVTGLSAATHSICLSPFVSAGTATIDSTNTIAKLAAYMLP